MKALLLGLIGFLLVGSAALAFEPPNIPHYPGSSVNSPMVSKVADTGVQTWQAVDGYGFNGWRNVVSRALDSGSSDFDSLANAYNRFLAADSRGQIVIREAAAGETPDIKHHAVSTAFLQAKCGEGLWYTACVYLLNPLPTDAYYKAAAMMLWPYESQAPVIRHEDNHALTRSCDQYAGGCPRASDGVWEGTVRCLGNLDSLMDCGGAARTATWYDYQTFLGAFKSSAAFLQIKPPPVPEWDDASCIDYDGEGSWIRACYNNWRGVWAGMRVVYYEYRDLQWVCVAECKP